MAMDSGREDMLFGLSWGIGGGKSGFIYKGEEGVRSFVGCWVYGIGGFRADDGSGVVFPCPSV